MILRCVLRFLSFQSLSFALFLWANGVVYSASPSPGKRSICRSRAVSSNGASFGTMVRLSHFLSLSLFLQPLSLFPSSHNIQIDFFYTGVCEPTPACKRALATVVDALTAQGHEVVELYVVFLTPFIPSFRYSVTPRGLRPQARFPLFFKFRSLGSSPLQPRVLIICARVSMRSLPHFVIHRIPVILVHGRPPSLRIPPDAERSPADMICLAYSYRLNYSVMFALTLFGT